MAETPPYVAALAPEAVPPGRAPCGNGPGGGGFPLAAGSVARGDLGVEKPRRKQQELESKCCTLRPGDGSDDPLPSYLACSQRYAAVPERSCTRHHISSR